STSGNPSPSRKSVHEHSSIKLRVGMFVLVALTLGGILTFVIGNTSSLFKRKLTYRGTFQNVSGLRAGSPVQLGGVNAGTVSRVDLEKNGRVKMEFKMVESARNLLREGSTLHVGCKGLLGDKVLDITVGGGRVLPVGSQITTEEPAELSVYLEQAGHI